MLQNSYPDKAFCKRVAKCQEKKHFSVDTHKSSRTRAPRLATRPLSNTLRINRAKPACGHRPTPGPDARMIAEKGLLESDRGRATCARLMPRFGTAGVKNEAYRVLHRCRGRGRIAKACSASSRARAKLAT